jgi:hypothetical protein
MYSAQVPRHLSSSMTRIPDLLDTLRQDYEQMGQEISVFKAQRDDYERKCLSPPNPVLCMHVQCSRSCPGDPRPHVCLRPAMEQSAISSNLHAGSSCPSAVLGNPFKRRLLLALSL